MFCEHEKVEATLNRIRCSSLDATAEIIQVNDTLKNAFSKAQQHILAAIRHYHEKNCRTGKARSIISARNTKPSGWKPDKYEPWMKGGTCDCIIIKAGKYDGHLVNFKVKQDEYPDKE